MLGRDRKHRCISLGVAGRCDHSRRDRQLAQNEFEQSLGGGVGRGEPMRRDLRARVCVGVGGCACVGGCARVGVCESAYVCVGGWVRVCGWVAVGVNMYVCTVCVCVWLSVCVWVGVCVYR